MRISSSKLKIIELCYMSSSLSLILFETMRNTGHIRLKMSLKQSIYQKVNANLPETAVEATVAGS